MAKFFKVKLNDHFLNSSIDRWGSLKENAQVSIGNALKRKNIINVNIEKRKMIIPLNKYKINESQLICFDFGKVNLTNIQGDSLYSEKILLEFLSFKIVVIFIIYLALQLFF